LDCVKLGDACNVPISILKLIRAFSDKNYPSVFTNYREKNIKRVSYKIYDIGVGLERIIRLSVEMM
jgi:hypothetical protein